MTTEVNVTTEVKQARRPRLDSEQGLLVMVGVLVLLGAVALIAVAGW